MFLQKPGVAQQLLEHWPDGLIGVDHYGKITFCNEKTCSILGWSIEVMVGQSAHELLCSKAVDYAHSEQECPMCLKEQEGEQALDHFEAWWIGSNGVYMNLDVRVLEPDINDLDISKILMFSECSSGTVSQYEARRLSMFAEFSPIPILEIVSPMTIEFSNPAMTDLMVEYGFNDDGVPNVLPENLESLISEVFSSKETVSNQEVEYSEKSFVWMFNPLIKNKKNFVQVYGLDVTELRRVQYELEEAKNVAERASDAKSHFLANMSHEIRTPMNAIVGFTEILMRSKLGEKQLGYCNKIKISSTVLLEVINDILDFSKIEAGKMKLEQVTFNLIENIEVLADLFADRAHESGVNMIFDIDQRVPAVLIGDPLRLKQVMINLVSNALKFTPKGTIEIIAKVVSSEEGLCRVRVEVKDTGKGIPKDKQAQLFAPFTQEDESTTRQFGGTGLGLSICRSLVELMDGGIGLRSKEGQGSVFFFEVNLAIADPVSVLDRQMSHYTVDECHKEVILLESDPISRRSLRHQLQSYGLSVHEFEGGVALVDEHEWAAKSSSILAVFCDDHEENIAWVQSLDKAIVQGGFVHSRLMNMTKLSATQAWGSSFQWPLEMQSSFERPLKPSIIGRSVLEKREKNKASRNVSVEVISKDKGRHLENYHILIVDDNAFNRELAKELLVDTRASLDSADDGKSAVELSDSKSYDFILMDIQMPVMDGFEATKIIKSRDPNQIVIALTANAIKGDRERFIAAGFDDYLSKPVDSRKLHDMIYFWADKINRNDQGSFDAVMDPIVLLENSRQKKAELSNTADEKVYDYSKMPLEFKGLKVAKALKMVGDKRTLYFKLIALFRNNYCTLSDDLLKALQEQDIITAARLVHTIKGSASNLGAEQLRISATELEDIITNGKDTLQDALSDFCVQLDTTHVIMGEFLDKFKHLG